MNRKVAQTNGSKAMKLAQKFQMKTNLAVGALLSTIVNSIRKAKDRTIFRSKVSTATGIIFAISASIVSLTALLSINTTLASAATSTANASINVASACTLTTTGTGTYSTTMNPGATKELTGSPLKVSCNDKNGYDLYAIGFSGDSYDTNNTDMLSSLGTSYNIKTNTSGSNSYWAMKVAGSGTNTPTIDNSYSNYKTIPTTYTKISHFTGTTTNSITTPTYKVTLSSDQAAGAYTGKVKYTIVHPSGSDAPAMPQPSTARCINYFANASDAVGTMGCQSATDGSSVTLLASNFSRTGYGFAGWSNKFDYATNTDADLKFYGPQETITAPVGTTANGLSLYAVWVKSEGNLQDTDKVTALCGTNGTGGSLTTAPTNGTANLSSVAALTDQRDNNTYAIAKLADGNCWMIENLRLESTAEHNSDGTLAQGYGKSTTYGNFGGLADAESAIFSTSTAANSLYYSGTQEGTANIDIGTLHPTYRMPRYNNINTSTRASNPTSNSASMYSYGNYYTWHAAIADLTYNDTNNQSTTGTSLCPTGWHLPKGGDKSNEANNELWSLVVDGINGGIKPANYDSQTRPYYTGTPKGSDASNKLRAYPNNFLYSGLHYSSSSAGNRGSNGYYWSSTAYNDFASYELTLYSSSVRPGTHYSSRDSGQSIRCTVGS